MNILQVITSFPPAYAYGGPVESSYNISKSLVKRGHDVSVFTTDVYNSDSRLTGYDDPEIREGIRIRRFKNISNHLAWTANISTAVGMWPALRTEIEKFDIVHLHEFRSIEAALTSYEAVRQNVPIVLQPRGSLARISKGIQKTIFDRLFGYRIVSAANQIIASSRVESAQYSEVLPKICNKPLSYVPNGIDQSTYAKLPEERQFREKYNISSSSNMILYLGRVHKGKGIDTLVRAFSDLELEQKCYLVIVGPDDGYLSQLKKLRDEFNCDNILFPGPKYGDEKLAAYLDADVFVLPSNYDSFGNVVIEAMACGTPTVTTDACGVSEWVDHESHRSVASTPQGLRTGIESILENSYSPSSIRQYIWGNFAWKAVATDMEDIYKEVVQ